MNRRRSGDRKAWTKFLSAGEKCSKNKFNAQVSTSSLTGQTYASAWERTVAERFMLLFGREAVSEQIWFVIQAGEHFEDCQTGASVKVRPVTISCDFVVGLKMPRGSSVTVQDVAGKSFMAIDTKGVVTKDYAIKRKMFQVLYRQEIYLLTVKNYSKWLEKYESRIAQLVRGGVK